MREHDYQQKSSEKIVEKSIDFTGRIIAIRHHKKNLFCDLFNGESTMQIAIELQEGTELPGIKVGDFIHSEGLYGTSKKGHPTLFVGNYDIVARPEEYVGEHPEFRELLIKRSKLDSLIRNFFIEQGVLEVDSKVLSVYSGSSNIEPFSTTDSSGSELHLRFTMELELKKYLALTQLPVFEIGKLFRNHGVSNRREAEFKAVEVYIPYMDLDQGMNLIKQLLNGIGSEFGVDLSDIPAKRAKELIESESQSEREVEQTNNYNDVYKKKVKRSSQPLFIINQPGDLASPFTARNPDGTAKDAKFVYGGKGTIIHLSQESTDYSDILRRLNEQYKEVLKTRPTAELDMGFLEEFRNGLPPCLGIYIGFDRLLAVLLNKDTIKEIIPGRLVK